MITTVSEEEIEFCECLFDPVALSECLFSDIDNLSNWDEDKYLHLRTYQLMFLSYEYSVAHNPKLSESENFKLLEGAGTIYNFGGRLTGKSKVALILDMMISLLLHDGWEVIVSSYDHLHVQQLLEKVIEPLIHHPFFKMFQVKVKRNPYVIRARNGHVMHGLNMNVNSNNEGANFFGFHTKKMYLEEASKETERVNEYRRESHHEVGCIAQGSKVLLSNFLTKNIEDIKIGDKILGYDEKSKSIIPTLVTNFMNQGKKDIIRIKCGKNQLWLTPDHKIRCQSEGDACYKWREAVRCSITSYLTQTLNYIEGDQEYNLQRKPNLVQLDGFKKQEQVYDLTTKTGNFIANGFIVHNCIERLSGMANFVKLSPAGKVFYNSANKSQVVNYPSFISPEWNERSHKRAVEKHSGENSPSFRVFVLGEPVVDAMYAIDMQRVEDNCVDKSKEIKNLEVSKETYFKFKTDLIVDKPNNTERMDLAIDVGENISEIIIVSKVNDKYKYLYNISLYQLTRKEILEILKFLIYRLEINVIAIDCGDGLGRDLYRDLEEIFAKDRELVWYQGNLKVKVDLLKDEKGNLVLENNSPVYEEEFHSEFSVRHLIEILYNGKIELPQDYKLLEQLGSVVAKQLGARTVFECYSVTEDHLFDCFKVWSLSEWEHQRTINKKIDKTNYFGGIV
jgi:hypothetical protein